MRIRSSFIMFVLSFGFVACNSKVKNEVDVPIVKEEIDTTENKLVSDAGINQTNENFSSPLRPNETITLNQTYTDTLVFSNYNDDYDYRLIIGEKNGKDVEIIYNWDWQNNDKYNFKYGDSIKVIWKIDRIVHAGDEEVLDFAERAIEAEHIVSKNNSVMFLWKGEKFNEELNQTFNSIFINDSLVNSITNQEKAALGYVATFIGNECSWDGDVNQDRSNLKCKILTALDLGYQCSDTHLGFLRRWFSEDSTALEELEICVTMPETATVQSTFDEISIVTDKNKKTIKVTFKAHRINIRESKSWSWTQTDTFEYNSENITRVDSEKSELIEESNNLDKTISYFEYSPDTIPNLALTNFAIEYAHLLDSKKVVVAYDKEANLNTAKGWGDKLLLLNEKNEILFESHGVGDVYLFEPHFYKSLQSNTIIVICQLGFEYYFGGKAFVFENGEITDIGTLDIEGNDPEKSLTDIVQIYEIDNELIFTFKSDSLILEPGTKDILIKNTGVKYAFNNEQLVLIN